MDAGLLKAQIGIGNLWACGARDFVKDGSTLMFRVGSNRKLAKIVIKLEADDSYSVRYVELSKRMKTFGKKLVDEKVEGIYCDNIGAVVRKMGDR